MKSLLAFGTACLLAAGVATAQDKGATPQYSGFLGDYAALQPVKDREGVLSHLNRAIDLKPYTKVMLDPVETWPNPAADYKGERPDVMKKLADDMATAFRRALEPQYQVVTAPGPDVLRVRLAITGITPVKPPLNPTDFLPIKAVFNFARSASGNDPRVVEMSAEMEVLDAANERVLAAVATRKGDQTLAQGDQVTWKHVADICDYWAQSFRQRLDELRGAGGAR